MTPRRITIAIAAAAVTAGLALAPAANAASHKVSIKLDGPAKGTVISGTWTEKTLGSGTLKGTLHIPVAVITFKVKGGTFTTTSDVKGCRDTAVTPPTFKGCWRVIRGTGKFKKARGGGKLSGNLDGRATYNGRLRY